jgi:rhodanese-related sulfurtransferase
MKKFVRFFIMLLLVSQFFPSSAVLGRPENDNAQKKETVYKMYEEYRKDFPRALEIGAKDAIEGLKAENLVFVDIREKEEIDVSMISGAITEEAFLNNVDEYKNMRVVVYCTIGSRSGKFAEKMMQKNIKVYNLKGGILAWVLEGGKVYASNNVSKRIHVYGKQWNYLPDEYEPVMFSFFERLLKKTKN